MILLLIECLPFAPVSGTDYANSALAVCESNSDDAVSDLAETVEARLHIAMADVLGDQTARVGERVLSINKRDAVLSPILVIFVRIPLEVRTRHA
jgi:hypothetical protein